MTSASIIHLSYVWVRSIQHTSLGTFHWLDSIRWEFFLRKIASKRSQMSNKNRIHRQWSVRSQSAYWWCQQLLLRFHKLNRRLAALWNCICSDLQFDSIVVVASSEICKNQGKSIGMQSKQHLNNRIPFSMSNVDVKIHRFLFYKYFWLRSGGALFPAKQRIDDCDILRRNWRGSFLIENFSSAIFFWHTLLSPFRKFICSLQFCSAARFHVAALSVKNKAFECSLQFECPFEEHWHPTKLFLRIST